MPKKTKSLLQEIKKLTHQQKLIKTRPPIPELDNVLYWLEQPSTVDWLIHEWNKLAAWYMFISEKQSKKIAQDVLAALKKDLHKNLHQDKTIRFNTRHFSVSAGINVYNWTLFSVAQDYSIGVQVASDKDIDLSQPIPELA